MNKENNKVCLKKQTRLYYYIEELSKKKLTSVGVFYCLDNSQAAYFRTDCMFTSMAGAFLEIHVYMLNSIMKVTSIAHSILVCNT